MSAAIYEFSEYYNSGRYLNVLRHAKHIQRHLEQDPTQVLFELSQALLDLEPNDAFKAQDQKVFAAYHQFISLYRMDDSPQKRFSCAAQLITACYKKAS